MSNKYSQLNEEPESLIDHNFVENDIIEPDQPAPATLTTSKSSPTSSSGQSSNMFRISFYRQYFDIDGDIFFHKIQKTLNPLTVESGQEESDELYGFIWLTGTLIFCMFVSSTGSNILADWIHQSKESVYVYNFDTIFTGMTLFYGYNLLVPFILYMVSYGMKFPKPLSVINTMSVYGYTNILWIPITLINLVVVLFISKEHSFLLNIIEWVLVSITGAITGLSNLRKVTPIIKENCALLHEDVAAANKLYLTILIGLTIAHTLFTVLVKIAFFGIY